MYIFSILNSDDPQMKTVGVVTGASYSQKAASWSLHDVDILLSFDH